MQKIVNRELRKWLETDRLALNIDIANFVLFHSSQRELSEHVVLKLIIRKLDKRVMYVFLAFYWTLPLAGSSTSPNYQKYLQENSCIML